MTSRAFKDRRDKVAFMQQLKEFRDETLLKQDLDPVSELDQLYWKDVRDGLFDDYSVQEVIKELSGWFWRMASGPIS